jgi:hypothetical protein
VLPNGLGITGTTAWARTDRSVATLVKLASLRYLKNTATPRRAPQRHRQSGFWP